MAWTGRSPVEEENCTQMLPCIANVSADIVLSRRATFGSDTDPTSCDGDVTAATGSTYVIDRRQ